MIVDTSALVAIIRDEPEASLFCELMATAEQASMSAANYVETAIVVDSSRNPVASRHLDRMVSAAGIVVADVTAAQAQLARAAYRDFGKGSGHPAGLNCGDCFAYALAKDRDEPLLFKGDDFGHTDVTPAA
ncbi:MAG: type II toxin-antitoxin system VapC family toxin [Candidatus Limnocylindria bacterium]